MSDTHYDVLVVARDATLEDIRKAYRALARQWHPDLFNHLPEDAPERREANLRFPRISHAYNTLSDSEQRMRYDASLPTSRTMFYTAPTPPSRPSRMPRPDPMDTIMDDIMARNDQMLRDMLRDAQVQDVLIDAMIRAENERVDQMIREEQARIDEVIRKDRERIDRLLNEEAARVEKLVRQAETQRDPLFDQHPPAEPRRSFWKRRKGND